MLIISKTGMVSTLDKAVQNLSGHQKKVGSVQFNPIANNVLVSSSTDLSVKIWDVERGHEFAR